MINYLQKVPPEIRIFQNLSLVDTLALIENIEKDTTASNDIKQGITHQISFSNFIKAIAHTNELGSTYTWASLHKHQQSLITMWEKPCNSAFLIAGLPNSGKSTVLKLITKKNHFELIEKLESLDKLQILRCSLQAIDYLGSESDVDTYDINFCEIAKPRNWYPTFRNSNHVIPPITHFI